MEDRSAIEDDAAAYEGLPPMTEESIRAALARGDADIAAGRTIPGHVFLAELRAKVDAIRKERAFRGGTDR